MKRILLLFCLTALLFGFFVFKPALAQEDARIPLNKYEMESLLDIIRKYPLTQAQEELYNDAIKYINQVDYSRKAGAVMLINQVILGQQLAFWFLQIPKDFSAELFKVIINLAPMLKDAKATGILINLFERYTVLEAKRIALAWIQQNEVKINVGAVTYNFESYKDRTQKADFQYIVLYKPTSRAKAEIIAEFYSKNSIEPPPLKGDPSNCPGGAYSHPQSTCWPFDIWLDQEMSIGNKDGLLEPFILRVKGSVIKTDIGQFVWDKSQGEPTVEVEFNKPVPQISQSDIILSDYEIEQQKSWVEKNILKPLQSGWQGISGAGQGIFDFLNNALAALQKGASSLIDKLFGLFQQANPKPANLNLSAGIGSALGGQASQLAEQLQGLLPKLGNLQNNLAVLDPNNLPQESTKPRPKMSWAEIVEQFDNLADMADNLFGQAETLLTAPSTGSAGSPQAGSGQATSTSGLNPVSTSSDRAILKQDQATSTTATSTPSTTSPQQGSGQATTTVKFCSLNSITERPSQDSLILNEIAWMGTAQSASHEWLELKNILPQPLNIAGWQIINQNQSIKIILPTSTLPAGGLYLLERTNDDSAPNVKADLIYTGALANTNEALYLFDNHCNLQDRIYANPNWPAGDNSSKRTLERKNIYQWQTSFEPGGTPKRPNSDGYYIPSAGQGSSGSGGSNNPPTSSPQATSTNSTSSQSATSTNSSSTPSLDVVISEIQLQNNEFIELYNSSSTAIDMTSWHLAYFTASRDWNNPSRRKAFSEALSAVIPAHGYYLIGLQGFPTSSTTSNPSTSSGQAPTSDWQPYDSNQLHNSDGAVSIFNCNPSIATSSTTTQEQAVLQAQACKIDAVGWGQTIVKEASSTLAAPLNQSLNRKLATTSQYQDTNNNLADFTVASSTPTNSQGQSGNFNPPAEPTNFQAVALAETEILLSWLTSADPDPNPNLSYYVYWSSQPITNANVTSSSEIASTSVTSTQLTISGLTANQLYYLGLQAFDGLYYSELVTTTVATLPPAITNLQASPSADREAISLFWTSAGTTSQYLVRYSDKPIVETATTSSQISWELATPADTANLALATTSGQVQLFNIFNLVANQKYYLAVKWVNTNGVTSTLSNIAQAKPRAGLQANSSSTVTDLLTGLTWVKDSQEPTFDYGTSTTVEQVKTIIENVNAIAGFDGYNNWRLPTLAELSQLLAFNKPSPVIVNGFDNVQPVCYWTSTNKPVQSGGATTLWFWSVNFGNGHVESNSSVANCRFLVVRTTSQACSATTQANPDSSQTDSCLKLEWESPGLHGSSLSWQQAMLSVFSKQDPATTSNWRLPQAQELMRAADTCNHFHWSLTPNYTDPDYVWATDLNRYDGVYLNTVPKTNTYYGWYVKDTD